MFLLVGGAVGSTVGYGAYYRGDAYRRSVETRLATFFGLPFEVSGIQPHSFTARQLNDVTMWLPDRRDQLFHCARAIWDTAGADGVSGTAVHIYDSTVTVGSSAWQREDYKNVLRASLAHNFRQANIAQVLFHRAALRWPRPDFVLRSDDVEGTVVFEPDGSGQAKFVSYSLNGQHTSAPIQIFARLDPHHTEFLPEVTLAVPQLPLTILGLGQMLQSPVTQGSFAGNIVLRQTAGGDSIAFKGTAHDVRLEELTQRLEGGPVAAVVNLSIDDALIRERRLERIEFNGEVRQVHVDSLLSRFGLPQIGGQLQLSVYGGRVADREIEQLRMSGEWTGGSLDKLAQAYFGRGGIQGQLRVRLNSLIVENNQVVSGNIDIIAEPPAQRAGTIERSLLIEAFQRQWGLSLPEKLLPVNVEFVQLGVKLLIDHQRVRVLSAQGPAGPAVITARILGQNVPLLGNMDQTFDVDPVLQRARARVEQFKGVLKRQFTPRSTSAPAPG